MSRSDEWHVSLGPLDFSIGVRSIHLDDVLKEREGGPGEIDAGTRLPSEDPLAVGRIRFVDDDVEGWESEGGSLGRGDPQPPSPPGDSPREPGETS